MKEISAHHESGHIAMAYLVGFSCDEVAIFPRGDGFSRMNYGTSPMPELVTALINYIDHPALFSTLPPNVRAAAPKASDKVCGMLIGGPVSEAFYKTGIDFEGDLPVELAGPDLVRVTSINQLLNVLIPNHNSAYITERITDIVLLIKQPQVWTAIEHLANKIILVSGHRLYRSGTVHLQCAG